MEDGTLEEFHARIIERGLQQSCDGRNTLLNDMLDDWHARMRERGLCGPADINCIVQNQMHIDLHYQSGASASCTSGWGQLQSHEQFGCASTFTENLAKCATPQRHAAAGCNISMQPGRKGVRLKNKSLPHPFAQTVSEASPPTSEAGDGNKLFPTDIEISAADRNKCGTKRALQRWADVDDSNLTGTLEDLCNPSSESRSCGGVWDQFEVNRNQFGVESTFKEDLSQYTTPLNFRLIPAEVKEWAESVAQEIEGAPRQAGAHFCSELEAGMFDQDNDEEELWSSVSRTAAESCSRAHWSRTTDLPPPPPPPPRHCGRWSNSWKKQSPQWRVKGC